MLSTLLVIVIGVLTATLIRLKLQQNRLQHKLRSFEEEKLIQSWAFYVPLYHFIHSRDYKTRLIQIRSEQKSMEDNGKAVVSISNRNWTLQGNEEQGQNLISAYKKLLLETFKNECEYAINKLNHKNIHAREKIIKNQYLRLNKMSKVAECEIAYSYYDWCLKELQLTYELKQIEQEEQEQKKRENDERRVIEKSKKAKQEAENAQQRKIQYQQEIERIRWEMQQTVGIQLQEYQSKIQQLEKQVAQANSEEEKAVSRYQEINSGTIYIISNVDSFKDKDIYRIGMNRKNLDGFINDINRAVPFPFNVHAKIFSEHGLHIEKLLHERFRDRRVNKLNTNREFFRVSLDEIKQAIYEISKETGDLKNIPPFEIFERAPSAHEHHRTLSREKDNESSSTSKSYPDDEIA
jgi:T5orf172 domain/Domain of unknown function (DUF4041)